MYNLMVKTGINMQGAQNRTADSVLQPCKFHNDTGQVRFQSDCFFLKH